MALVKGGKSEEQRENDMGKYQRDQGWTQKGGLILGKNIFETKLIVWH